MNRKVKYLRLHQGVFIPAIGDIGNVLPAPMKRFELDMVDIGTGVQVKVTNGGVSVETRIPDGNISLIVYAPEEPKAAVKK